MPSVKHGLTWKAEPHTLAKIAMLKAYLHAYFLILGRSKSGLDVLYVDGFAGPGEYTNSPTGSPIAALAAARAAVSQLGSDWRAGIVNCVFIEPDADRCGHLRDRLKPFEGDQRVRPRVVQASFVDGMEQVRSELPEAFRSDSPLFVFIDPFGATGVPFGTVVDILLSPCSEVLINLDADGIARIFRAEARANHEAVLTTVFGDQSWRQALDVGGSFHSLCQQVLNLYKTKLRAIPRVRYAYSFEMRGAKDTLNYHLVFASQHALGLEKMKEAMRQIDQSGSYCFSDGRVGEVPLFRDDDPAVYAEALHAQGVGREFTYAQLRDHALNETPFLNPKAMLRVLDKAGLLSVSSTNPRRRRGDFDERTVTSIHFVPKPQPPVEEKGLWDGRDIN